MDLNVTKALFAALRSGAIGIALAVSGCASSTEVAQAPFAAQDVAQQVETIYGEWRDEARDRAVPYKIYLPATHGPAPIVIFSHGLGGSREAANYLMTYLAQHGFVGVVLQHPGSDSALLGGERDPARAIERLRAGMDARSAIARFGDVRFAIDQLEAANVSGPLARRLDLSRIGMSGHSYGALTTLVAVGQRLRGGAPEAFRDARIDAAIVYSPNAPREQAADDALGGITTPILHFTGTEDRTPLDLEESPAGRQIPFQTIRGADQYLIVFDGGDHMIFSGRVQAGGAMTAAQAAQTQAIERESLMFWRAYLLGDAQALADLCALPARVEAIGVGEVRATRCAAN